MAKRSTSSSPARRVVASKTAPAARAKKPAATPKPSTRTRGKKPDEPVVIQEDAEESEIDDSEELADSVYDESPDDLVDSESNEVETFPPKTRRKSVQTVKERRKFNLEFPVPTLGEFFIGLLIFVLVFALIAPHLKRAGWIPFLPIPVPVSPVASFSDVTTSVDTWMEEYAGDDAGAAKRSYVKALDIFLADYDQYQTNVDAMNGFRNTMRDQMGGVEFANFGLFNVSLYELAKVAKSDGRLDATSQSHKPFFEALKKGLENAK